MLKLTDHEIVENIEIADRTWRMSLKGDNSAIARPGQFVNLEIEGLYLRRPLSVSHLDGDTLTLVYKVVGSGTSKLSNMRGGEKLNLLTGLGNGFDTSVSGDSPLLIAGGVGAAPMLWLAEELAKLGKTATAGLGFGTASEVFLAKELESLGVSVKISTEDGSTGVRGYVTDVVAVHEHDYVYVCGPEPMMQAVYELGCVDGQYSFEERMGCGFGACMGCTCETLYGYKRICRDGPVLLREEIKWK